MFDASPTRRTSPSRSTERAGALTHPRRRRRGRPCRPRGQPRPLGRGVEHVVLERGEVANTWKTERWDSLRLLTPNWQTRLPGLAYDGDDPDGFMAVPELVAFLERYAEHVDAPVRTQTDGHLASRPATRATSCRPPTEPGRRPPSSWPAAPSTARSVPAVAAVAAGRARPGHAARLQASRPAAAGPRAGRRRLGHRPPDRRRAAALRAARSRSPSASTSACRGPTGAATSCGGSTGSAASTSATTRSTTSCAPATSPRRSSSARPTAPTSTSTP